jgi:hypothetical protein
MMPDWIGMDALRDDGEVENRPRGFFFDAKDASMIELLARAIRLDNESLRSAVNHALSDAAERSAGDRY